MELSRFDLFHGHAFLSHEDSALGILFHAKEFPAECEEFPYNLGFCQDGTDLSYSDEAMAWRNYVWFEVRAVVQIAHAVLSFESHQSSYIRIRADNIVSVISDFWALLVSTVTDLEFEF